jgi:hypothetical protein
MLAAAKAARARRPVKRTRVLAAIFMLDGTNWDKNRRLAPAKTYYGRRGAEANPGYR